MYLFLSLFFFGVIALLVPSEVKFDDDPKPKAGDGAIAYGVDQGLADVAAEAKKKEAADAARKADAAKPGKRKVAGGEGFGIHIDDGSERVELTDADSGFLKEAEDRATHNVQRLQDDPEYRGLLLRKGIGNLPLMMFLLLPIYALFLKLLYVRSGRYYVEHLIYSLHLHSFVFLTLGAIFAWLGALDALGYVPVVNDLVVAGWWFYFVLYPLLAMKRVYGQGWLKTSFKYFILGITYVVLLAFGLVFAVILTLST